MMRSAAVHLGGGHPFIHRLVAEAVFPEVVGQHDGTDEVGARRMAGVDILQASLASRGWRELFRSAVMLVVFGGLPGTGKTTISRVIATRRSAMYLRIDIIEQALRSAGVLAGDVGPSGYVIGNALAASNLANGHTVIADCVNPVRESRQGWRVTADRARSLLIEIEIVCSDLVEHRRRIEERSSDIDGLLLPSWQAVLDRDYSPWHEPHVVIDTSRVKPDEAVAIVERYMDT